MPSSIEVLAAQIEHLRRQVAALKAPQLTSSSIDDGSLTVTQTQGDGSSQVTTIIGQQFDGTSGAVTVAGPTPPIPDRPTLATVIGGVNVTWGGSWQDPQFGFASPVVAPLDFQGVDVQVSDDPSFTVITLGTNAGTITSAAGGSMYVPWPMSGTQLYARLIARSKAGKFSAPSRNSDPAPSGQIQLGDLGFDVAQYGGGNSIYYTDTTVAGPTAPAWGFTAGDLWLQQTGSSSGLNGSPPVGSPLFTLYRWSGVQWVPVQDQGVANSLATAITAQNLATSKATVFTQPTKPIWSGPAGSAYWIEQPDNISMIWDGANWVPFQIGNGAIQPNSLIASNVMVTGTVTAALLEANMVLANTLIAGNIKGDHATMQADGFHIWRLINGEGVVEVGRLATSSSNFFGIADSTGQQVATIDDAGGASFTDLNINNDPVFQGNSLSGLLTRIPGGGGAGTVLPGGRNYVGWDASAVISGVTTEVGLIEMAVTVEQDRIYYIVPSFYWTASGTSTYIDVKIRDGGSGTPSISSPIINQDFFSTGNNGAWTLLAERHRAQRFSAGLHRLLLTVTAGGTGSVNVVNPLNTNSPQLQVIDLGPDFGNPATTNRGGGGTPAPTQQFYVDLAPSGTATYRGNGVQRTDTGDIVQGWDPSGFNGDGSGWWTFNLPTITGTVDRVDFYAVSNHTFFNSGGQGIFRPIHTGPPNWPMSGLGNASPQVFTPYPNSGPVQVTLPSAWYSSFASAASPRSIGIAAGPAADIGGGTNETFYVRFDGPSARLRIWYTQ